jgi:signal transduction histidine kinase
LARASQLVLAERQEDGGTPVGRVVMLSDITELQRTIQMRTDFVANASHELRTPLSTIRAAVETMRSMDLSTEQPAAQQFLAKIDRQSARLQQMVVDLLDLSRIESPTERFEPEAVESRRVLHDLYGRFAESLERKQLHWETGVSPEDTVTVNVNPHLLRLVLDNLVDNAIKFTEPDGQIRVNIRLVNGRAEFEVCDTGCGIPAKDQERVFERFYQVQRSRSGPERGTGLGLSIVRHAVGAMRGSVALSSAPGEGTTVKVSVPQARDR